MEKLSGISIVVPVFNYSIENLLTSLQPVLSLLKVPHELIYVDDCSTDTSITQRNIEINLESKGLYLILKQNIGRAAVRNFLAEQAQYSHLLFIDVDSKIPSKEYLDNYLKHISEADIIVGGTCYDTTFNPAESLRYFYGKKREETSAFIRNKNPYDRITLNNMLISREVYLNSRLDENFRKYGHEDTKFGYQLKENKIPILHIDNPVIHIGLEANQVFLDKTKVSIDNLIMLEAQGYKIKSELYNSYLRLKRWRMIGIFNIIYRLFQKMLVKNLLSSRPSIFLFEVYKLKLLIDKLK